MIRGLVTWAVRNSPAVNTLMVGMLIVGFVSALSLKREVFPEFELEIILITVPYPGASPDETEEGICQKIEEAVRGIDGIKRLASIAQEGAGYVILEMHTWVDVRKALSDVRSEVDRIPGLPELAEDPEIQQLVFREPAIRVAVLGPDQTGLGAELKLRDVAEKLREELLRLPTVSQASLIGIRPYQIDVEVPEARLREYGLTLGQIAGILRGENLELPGGTIRGEAQEVLLRGKNKRLTGHEIAELPLVTQTDGAVLKVKDLALVRDGFEDIAATSRVDGKPAVIISVDRSRSEDLLRIVDEVKSQVAITELPAGYSTRVWGDRSLEVRDRMRLLVTNGLQGLVLVLITLALFLDFKLAFWVAMGIPFSMMGACLILLTLDKSLNMLTMFAFLMVVGIVVDDAIVIGENIFERRIRGEDPETAAIEGTMEVAASVVSSVLTTVIAFLPLCFVSGIMGKFIAEMPLAVVATLLISLFEAIFLLPSHLAELKLEPGDLRRDWGRVWWRRGRNWPALARILILAPMTAFGWIAWHLGYPVFALSHAFRGWSATANALLDRFILRSYTPILRWAIARPAVTIAASIAFLFGSLSVVNLGITRYELFPELDGNEIFCSLTFADGTPAATTAAAAEQIERTIRGINTRLGQEGRPVVRVVLTSVGDVRDPSQLGPDARASGSNVARVDVELVDSEHRDVTSQAILAMWREETPPIAGLESILFASVNKGPGGTPIEFRVMGDKIHMDELEAATEDCKRKLAEYEGIVDIRDDSRPGKYEFQLRIKDKAQALGISLAELARTVRGAFYGEEVMRLQRGRHEVKLMVRYSEAERRQTTAFDDIRVRTPEGAEYPLRELADVQVTRGYSEINRIDQHRCIAVLADIDPSSGATSTATVADLRSTFIPGLLKKYPHVRVLWEGQQQQSQESVSSMIRGGLVAIVAMYLLLTIEFRSYFQPFLILMIIPFGMVGAICGHALMGLSITIFTMFGMVALTGVVVNDSIVLLDAINHRRRAGMPMEQTLIDAGQRRFRPVMLTSVTTIAGLAPMLTETSFQAQFLLPLAATLVFGLATTTVLALILLPAIYSIYDRLVLSPSDDGDGMDPEPARRRRPAKTVATRG